MILATHATRNWLPRLKSYLHSLNEHSPFENYVLTVDCDAPAEYMADVPRVSAVRIERPAGAPEPTQSPQHGAFIQALPGADDDILIFTDGDVVMQRPPTDAELHWLSNIGDGVACGWNSGPGETLMDEARRLQMMVSDGELSDRWGGIVYDANCYNIGVIAARRSTWRRIYDRYMALWDNVCATFAGPARQQWLVCYVMARDYIPVRLMPQSMHTHGCYALPAGCHYDGGLLTYKGETVLFKHHL